MNTEVGATLTKKAVSLLIAQTKTPRLIVVRACRFLKISRQAWYQRCQRKQRKAEQASRITEEVQKTLNGRTDAALHIGRDSLFSLPSSGRAYHKTTHSRHRFFQAPESAESRYRTDRHLWPRAGVGGGHHLASGQNRHGLREPVTDAFSRKIVGYHVHESLPT